MNINLVSVITVRCAYHNDHIEFTRENVMEIRCFMPGVSQIKESEFLYIEKNISNVYFNGCATLMLVVSCGTDFNF